MLVKAKGTLKSEKDKLDPEALNEGEKLSFESMKHITTLTTSSLVLLVAFLEKLLKDQRNWQVLVVITFASFIVSIICSVSSMLQSANFVRTTGKIDKLALGVKRFMYNLALVTFVLGLISLVVFALKNLKFH